MSSKNDQERQWKSNRRATLRRIKARLRKRVKEGYYPITQISGRPMVAVGEPI